MLTFTEYPDNPVANENINVAAPSGKTGSIITIYPCFDGFDIHIAGEYKASISLDKQADLWFITRGELNNTKLLNETVSSIGAKYYR